MQNMYDIYGTKLNRGKRITMKFNIFEYWNNIPCLIQIKIKKINKYIYKLYISDIYIYLLYAYTYILIFKIIFIT